MRHFHNNDSDYDPPQESGESESAYSVNAKTT